MDAIVRSLKETPAAQRRIVERPTREEAEEAVRILIAWAGDDPEREGLLDTPKRVIKSYEEMFGGYWDDPSEVLNRTFVEVEGYSDVVLVRDIPFHSHCEHHMVPILGKAHFAYYPSAGVVGLSKLARLIDSYARRLQTQETMTSQIINTFDEVMKPRGAALMVEAEHLCMSMRGIQKTGTKTVTMDFTGIFKTDTNEQTRFLSLIRER